MSSFIRKSGLMHYPETLAAVQEAKDLNLQGFLSEVLIVQSRQQVTAPISTIDSTLQTNATAILESKLSEINAQSGQVIVMEVQSGQIKALVGLTRKDSANYQSCENFSVWQSTGLMHPISLLPSAI